MKQVLNIGFESSADTLNGQVTTTYSVQTSSGIRESLPDTSGSVRLSAAQATHGKQSMFCSRTGPITIPTGDLLKNIRCYQALDLNMQPYSIFQPINRFYWSMNIYVPTQPLVSWLSFATIGAGDGLPFTIDANKNRSPHLYISLATSHTFEQNLVPTPLLYPFDRWFNLAALCDLTLSPQELTVFLDGKPIINYSGLLLNGPFKYGHFGAYFGVPIGTTTISMQLYNDDLELWSV